MFLIVVNVLGVYYAIIKGFCPLLKNITSSKYEINLVDDAQLFLAVAM
jgi:hypothetical protein